MKLFKTTKKKMPSPEANETLKNTYTFESQADYLELEDPYSHPRIISRNTKTKDSDDCFLFI